MAMNQVLGTFGFSGERAATEGHPPVLQTGNLKTDDGVYPVGLVLSRNTDDKLAPLAEVEDESIGTGDASAVTFSGTLANAPVEPGTVSAGDGVESFADDGCGRLSGDAGGSGTVNYRAGAVSVTFNAAPAEAADVAASYETAIAGVLDEKIDTSQVDTGVYVVHGTVRRDVLKVGKTAQAAPSSGLLMRLAAHGIYPVG